VHRRVGIVAGDIQLAECALCFRQCINEGLLDCDVDRTGMMRLSVRESVRTASSSFWMSAMTTLAPASASTVAIAGPMPETESNLRLPYAPVTPTSWNPQAL